MRTAGTQAGDPKRKIVALSGDYRFQFTIDELAASAQQSLPHQHIVVNNSYLGLVRQARRGFHMNFALSQAFENIDAHPNHGDAVAGRGLDYVVVAEGFACKAITMKTRSEFTEAFARARVSLVARGNRRLSCRLIESTEARDEQYRSYWSRHYGQARSGPFDRRPPQALRE
jgi:glyoxylate carboligase